MTTIKNSKHAVTLTLAHPNVTITGTIDATGHAGHYVGGTLSAAVFGPASPKDFTLTNTGTILGKGTANTDFAIVLADEATLRNKGIIESAAGLFGNAAVTITNSGLIDGTKFVGVELINSSPITNTGTIEGATDGIFLSGGGTVTNTGTITAADAIYAKAGPTQIFNAGLIDGTSRYGVEFSGTLTNAAAGIIRGDYLAANLYGPGAIANFGLLTSNDDGVFLENLPNAPAGSTSSDEFFNAGTIYGPQVGIRIQEGVGDIAYLTNSAAGLITAGPAGRAAIAGYVENLLFITNAGTIEGPTGIEFSGPATIQNTGLIAGTGATGNAGITLGGGTLTNAGTIIGATGISVLSGGLVEELGTVTGTSGTAISFRAGSFPFAVYQNTLALAPGAVINGTVDLFGTLILGGAEFGSLNDATGSLNLSEIVVPTEIIAGAGATWHLSGAVPDDNAGTIFNQGTLLTDPGGTVITGASVFNQGYIGGGAVGIGYGIRYLDNSGTVAGTKTAVQLANSSSLVNSAAGTIAGISLALGETLHNAGAVTAFITGTGADSYLINQAGGRITAATDAILLTDAIDLYNAGYIKGGSTAIAILGGAITNFGTIIGTKYAISVASDSNARLILSPTAVTQGMVDLGNGYLQLTAGSIAGTVTNAQFKNIYKTTVATGAAWDLAGTYSADAVVNDGTIDERSAEHLIILDVSGTGTIEMPKFLSIGFAAAAGQKIEFSGTGETLALGDAPFVQATLRGFAHGDTIDLTNVSLSSITSLSFANNILTLHQTTGSLTLTFTTDHDLSTDFFHLSAAGAGTAITLSPTAALPGLLPHHLATSGTTLAPLITFSP